jgi:hypothetical protein
MNKVQKRNFLILCLLSIIVLILFIAPNMHGAENPEMLSVFQPDEYAQYPYLMHMLNNTGQNFIQSIHTFLVYGHYYYGYPFYFFSGLALLPVKLILGANWQSSTPLLVMILRETINVLPMLVALLLLVWMFTKYRSLCQSILLFVFLETLPQVIANNVWWHPDSLLVLFSVLTLFFLQRDRYRLGINFFISAITCGLAITSKVLGVLFVGTYFIYLVIAVLSKKVSPGKALAKAGIFLLLMAAAIVVSMPQLIMPQERAEIIAVFKGNLSENQNGFWVQGGGLTQNWQTLTGYIPMYYSQYWIFLPALVLGIAGLFSEQKRLTSILVLSWSAVYCGYFLFFAATLRPHYFLPVFLPLLACLSLFWPESEEGIRSAIKDRKLPPFRTQNWINLAAILLMLVSVAMEAPKLGSLFNGKQSAEANSPSIQFYDQVYDTWLDKMPTDKNFTLYRDWRAYVAPQSNWNVVMSWDLMDYDRLAELKPVVIFLEEENINYFSDASKQAIALDTQGMKRKYLFYSDAKADQIKGYVLLEENEFGKAFAREDFFKEYLQK